MQFSLNNQAKTRKIFRINDYCMHVFTVDTSHFHIVNLVIGKQNFSHFCCIEKRVKALNVRVFSKNNKIKKIYNANLQPGVICQNIYALLTIFQFRKINFLSNFEKRDLYV